MTHWSKRHAIIPASYVIFERGGKILLMRRAGNTYMEGHYTMPAGHFDGNESARMVAAREALEEVGLVVKPENLEMVHCMVYRAIEGDHDRVSFFFQTTNFAGEPENLEPEKCDQLKWVDPAHLPAKMVWEAAHALAQIEQGNVYSEVNFVKEAP